jgi:PhnB protein
MKPSCLILLACALGLSGCAPQAADQTPGPISPAQETTMHLSTYLLFDGTCREAMTFYHAVLGGELTLTTVGDSPMAAMFPASAQGRIVNARLTGAGVELSASDWLHPDEAPVRGNMNCLYLSGGTPDETASLFVRLSSGASVTDPLTAQPFGWYGALNDRFGVRWMFHADAR